MVPSARCKIHLGYVLVLLLSYSLSAWLKNLNHCLAWTTESDFIIWVQFIGQNTPALHMLHNFNFEAAPFPPLSSLCVVTICYRGGLQLIGFLSNTWNCIQQFWSKWSPKPRSRWFFPHHTNKAVHQISVVCLHSTADSLPQPHSHLKTSAEDGTETKSCVDS